MSNEILTKSGSNIFITIGLGDEIKSRGLCDSLPWEGQGGVSADELTNNLSLPQHIQPHLSTGRE
ncbi:hypothetical protein HDF18_10375 [Mucilaginibacter sp. X5P1]|uniref:hypothetical protein n=1 Tax=Mucilaginibacter sp. X5P1 TaxID=2723088 RepID=UPI00160E7AAC|nr:hypothetical protein [Mucilaginibacter sp. X5P1]MBB6140775.1 hypothetical protein [Mucilaginibacter sp. X5P1]